MYRISLFRRLDFLAIVRPALAIILLVAISVGLSFCARVSLVMQLLQTTVHLATARGRLERRSASASFRPMPMHLTFYVQGHLEADRRRHAKE